MTDWTWIVLWVGVFGVMGALFAPRKGYTSAGGFVMCAVFGIFGLAYLAFQKDV